VRLTHGHDHHNIREYADVWRCAHPGRGLFDVVVDSEPGGDAQARTAHLRLTLERLGRLGPERTVFWTIRGHVNRAASPLGYTDGTTCEAISLRRIAETLVRALLGS